MPPQNILNAPTRLMKNLGYGAGYEYDHDTEDGFSGANYFPEAWAGRICTGRWSADSSGKFQNAWPIGQNCAKRAHEPEF